MPQEVEMGKNAVAPSSEGVQLASGWGSRFIGQFWALLWYKAGTGAFP